MTIEEGKERLVAWARGQVGYPEGVNNWNKYAENKDLQRLYGWYPQKQPWCDLFVDTGFIECFGLDLASKLTYQPIGHGSAACRYSAGFYSAHEAFYDTPQIGDQSFYFVDDGINHTGIVVETGVGYFRAVEGNSSDAVRLNTYRIGNPSVAGFGRPDWPVLIGEEPEAPADPAPEAPQEPQGAQFEYCDYTYQFKTNLLVRGNYGPQVRQMQNLLNANGFDCGKADGIFGPNTESALMRFQRAAGIPDDGEWGGQSASAMWNYEGGGT